MTTNLFERMLKSGRAGAVLDDGVGRPLTWPDIESLAAGLAGTFARWGLRKGDRLAVCAQKSVASFVLYLAALRSGLGYLPINTALSAREIGVILEAARPRVLVFDADQRSAGETGASLGVGRLIEWRTGAIEELLDGSVSTAGVAATGPGDLAVLIFTSGTTGRPKGAMLSHGNLLANAVDLAEIWRLGPHDVVLHALPIFHGHGLLVAGLVPLLAGAGLILLPRFDAEAVIDRLPEATVMMGVPTFYSRLLASPRFAGADLSSVRLFTCGSAPMPGELAARFRAVSGRRIIERYGTTEATIITSERIDDAGPAGTVGAPLPSVELRICDPDGRVLPEGGTGSVEVRGPAVFAGYLDDPAATRQAFAEGGWFITGDLGRMEAGRLHLVGRQKDLIISGGYNVYAKEVENVLDALHGVAESAVIGVPHADFGEAVVAVVVGDASMADPVGFAARIRREARDQLSNYKAPKSVQIVDSFPRNAMGKVLKTALRDQYKDLFVETGESAGRSDRAAASS